MKRDGKLFGERIGVVADRGMISAATHPLTLCDLETRNIDYILGVRERATKEVRGVIADPTPWVPLSSSRRASDFLGHGAGSGEAVIWSDEARGSCQPRRPTSRWRRWGSARAHDLSTNMTLTSLGATKFASRIGGSRKPARPIPLAPAARAPARPRIAVGQPIS